MMEPSDPLQVSFDVDAALEAARTAADGDLLTFAVYTPEAYELRYVDDDVKAYYGDQATVAEVADALHRYVHIDFVERELFDDLLPRGDETYAFTTHMAGTTVVRVLCGNEGVFLSLGTDADVTDVIDVVAGTLGAPC